MSIFEYDQERHLQMEREDAREEGIEVIVTNMMKQNLSKELILSVTNIPLVEYEKIHSKINKLQ